jgi:hypothetical protein
MRESTRLGIVARLATRARAGGFACIDTDPARWRGLGVADSPEATEARVGSLEDMVFACGELGFDRGDEYADPATYLAAADTRERLRRLGRLLELGAEGVSGDEELKPGEEDERSLRRGRDVGAGCRLEVFRVVEPESREGVGRWSARGVVYLRHELVTLA